VSPPRTKPTDIMETAISEARTSIAGTQTAIPTATLTATPTVIPSPTLTLIPIPTSSVNFQSAISMANECRTTVDEIYKLKKDLELPDHFNNGNLLRQATDFDPNQYFQILTHLRIKSGYKLDYIYFSDDLGGKPLMYARKSNTAPFPTYEEFLKSYGEEMSGERSYSELHHAFDFLNKIQIDKSYESYYQFIVLTFLGDQFYLSWHGEYNDLKILCDLTDMKYVNEDMKDFDVEFPLDVVNRIEKIDFRPVVVENESTITVRFISFTKWGGFYENIYTVNKEKEPMEFIDIQWNPLIEYDCGISF
jgi:hypothetical protein